MTLDNLSSILDGVENIDIVGHYLQIPRSKLVELQSRQYDTRQIHTAWSSYFISHHPTPSWRIVALALWGAGELRALKVVQKLYLEGEPCTWHAHCCRRKGKLILFEGFRQLVMTFLYMHLCYRYQPSKSVPD
jgi:hypothetical protein